MVINKKGLTILLVLTTWLLASCGNSSKYQEFIPKRIVSIGDEISYFGGAQSVNRFTVNLAPSDQTRITSPATQNNWVWTLADLYRLCDSQLNCNIAEARQRSALISDLPRLIDTIQAQNSDMLLISIGASNTIRIADEVGNGTRCLGNLSDSVSTLCPGSPLLTAHAEAKVQGGKLVEFAKNNLEKYNHIFIFPLFDFGIIDPSKNKSSPFATRKGMVFANYPQNLSALILSFNLGVISSADHFVSGKQILFLNQASILKTPQSIANGTISGYDSKLYDQAACATPNHTMGEVTQSDLIISSTDS
ncbi:MAG: hypothetical protein QM520_02055, partial [Gammaproteobacteria bacterium]|nr:hypothetical protein [Gammaproteobacteria bacterium]